MQRQIIRRALGTTANAPKETPKGPWERLKDYLLFRPGAPSWASYPRKTAVGAGYRFPSPASRPEPNIPTVEDEDDLFNTQYYTRDTARNQPLPRLISAEPPKEFPVEPPAELGSKGRKNPAVERYDPTGTRSAMTTSWKAMNDALAKRQPDHFAKAWWELDPKLMESEVEHAQKNGLPLPIGVARQSLGIPRYGKNEW